MKRYEIEHLSGLIQLLENGEAIDESDLKKAREIIDRAIALSDRRSKQHKENIQKGVFRKTEVWINP